MRCLYEGPVPKSGRRRRSSWSGVESKERVSDNRCQEAWPSLGVAIQSTRKPPIVSVVVGDHTTHRTSGKSGAPHKGSGLAAKLSGKEV